MLLDMSREFESDGEGAGVEVGGDKDVVDCLLLLLLLLSPLRDDY